MNKNRPVFSVLEKVAVDMVVGYTPKELSRYFHDAELDAIAHRPMQSVAGIIALKRALALLCAELDPTALALGREHDFLITSQPHHPPVINAMPKVLFNGISCNSSSFRISITHSPIHAFGLAVFQEGSND